MSELREIGTIVEFEFPPTFSDTAQSIYWRVITYRVKGHVKVARFQGDEVGKMAEELQTLDKKYYQARQLFFPGNQMIWARGEEIEEEAQGE